MKYKVGDKVRIRSDLKIGEEYGGIIFLDEMAKVKGKEVIINWVSNSGNYYIKESGCYYTEEMLENVKENETVLLVAGVFNGTTQVLYWKQDISLIYNIGDYAIVENKQGYDLIKIVGNVETRKTKAKLFSHTKYEDMKNIVSIVKKNDLEVQK